MQGSDLARTTLLVDLLLRHCNKEPGLINLLSLRQYTEQAQHALVLAEEEAIAGDDGAVGSGHILVGMLAVPGCTAALALESLGISVEAARHQLRGIFHSDEDGISSIGVSPRIPLTKMAHALLAQARLYWQETGHAARDGMRTPEGLPYVCTGEILLAIIGVHREVAVGPQTAAAVQVLVSLDVELSAAYEQIVSFIRDSPADEPER